MAAMAHTSEIQMPTSREGGAYKTLLSQKKEQEEHMMEMLVQVARKAVKGNAEKVGSAGKRAEREGDGHDAAQQHGRVVGEGHGKHAWNDG